MESKLDYRIGLDIGIASVGWAVLQNNTNDEPIRIVDMGVRIFDKAEIAKTGDPLAGPRRAARSARRRLRRRRHRLDRIKFLFEKEGLINIDSFDTRYNKNNLPDVYELRYKALDSKLTNDELAQVLLHIAKHRGFKSNRKAETESKENGQVLSAISANREIMEEKHYRTVGEMLYLDENFRTSCPWSESGYILTPRNKSEDYKHTILRSMLVDEIKAIFESQRLLGNSKASKELEEKYLEIMQNQRSFDMGPGSPSLYSMEGFEDRVGKCTFEHDEKRAAKATYTAQLFVALQKINHTSIINADGVKRLFSDDEREIIIELMHNKKEVKYSDVRKKLQLADSDKFYNLNYGSKYTGKKTKSPEESKFVSMQEYYEYCKCLGDTISDLSETEKMNLLDEVGRILTLYKNDDSRRERLNALGIESSAIEKLLVYSPSKFLHLSIKAMRKIIPYLQTGCTYDKACSLAGYDFRANSNSDKKIILKGDDINEIINDITNPVVKRSVSQTVKVINAIIQKYGSPQAVNIELAREMSKNFQERRDIEKDNEKHFKQNDDVIKMIREKGVHNPTGLDIIKYRLWTDQQGQCLYTGKKIPLEELFKPGYDIDHILPYSITFDDSYNNKVLVTSQANRQKGNRTPFEYFGQNEEEWRTFESRIANVRISYKKQQKLLKRHITEEECSEFKERNLTDTKYITTVIRNMIEQNLKFAEFSNPNKKKHVLAVNGVITNYLSKRWGLSQKDRSTDTHHSRDAVVIACCTDGMINKISRYAQGRELRFTEGFTLVDEETGEIFRRDNFSREEWDEMFGVKIPLPWTCFKDELDIRMGTDPKSFIETNRDVDMMLNYPEEIMAYVRPIFVSRMPNHKVTGPAHDATIRSSKEFDKGYVISKTALTDLKLDKDGEIANYYDPDSDKLLYSAIVEQLREYSNDAKKAFENGFHKPKADGTPGPIVRKVKTIQKQTTGVLVNVGKGVASNGSMIRIDVFRENGKYFYVPIYTADVVKKELPNKAATAYKPYNQWREMKDENFLFSLYSRDLIHIKSKKGVKLNYLDKTQQLGNDIYVYYVSSNTATASIAGISNDKNFSFEGLGIQGLDLIEKCQVDVLGNISTIRREKRMGFN